MTRTRNKIISGDIVPYFITSTVIDWISVFNNHDIANIVIETLNFRVCLKVA